MTNTPAALEYLNTNFLPLLDNSRTYRNFSLVELNQKECQAILSWKNNLGSAVLFDIEFGDNVRSGRFTPFYGQLFMVYCFYSQTQGRIYYALKEL